MPRWVWRVTRAGIGFGQRHGLQQLKVGAVRPVLPVIALVVRPRPDRQMLRVDAPSFVAAVPDHIVHTRDRLGRHVMNKAIRPHLTPPKP